MDPFSLFDFVQTQLDTLTLQLNDIFNYVFAFLGDLVNSIGRAFQTLGSLLLSGIKAIIRGFEAIKNLSWSSIWHKLVQFYDRFKRTLKWLDDHVYGPIRQMQITLNRIYNQIFGPVLRILDTLRHAVRILAIFNRKLAAELDSKIFGLEQKILAPLLAATHRLNLLASTLRAFFTQFGLLDRVLLIESIRRDAGIVIGTVLNPRSILQPHLKKVPRRTMADVQSDYEQFIQFGTGPYADSSDHLQAVYDETRLELA